MNARMTGESDRTRTQLLTPGKGLVEDDGIRVMRGISLGGRSIYSHGPPPNPPYTAGLGGDEEDG